jgi:hypothetical protein
MDLFEHTENSRPSILETLERCRITLKLDVSGWCEILGLTRDEFLTIRKGLMEIPAFSILYAAEFLSLTPGELVTGQLDYPRLARRILGPGRPLPERYSTAAFSKTRSPITVLNYIEQRIGWRERIWHLRRLGLDDGFFVDPTEQINIRFITDLLQSLSDEGFSDAAIFEMGAHSLHTNRGTVLSQVYSQSRRPSEIYEHMFGDLQKQYEMNCDYSIVKMTGTSCVVESRSRKSVADELRVRSLGSHGICGLRTGIMSSATGYLGLPFAKVSVHGCEHSGDAACRFEIDFEKAKTTYSNRSLSARQSLAS